MAHRRKDADEVSGPRLLSGGNPQIPEGDGDEPVQAYLEAVPATARRSTRNHPSRRGAPTPATCTCTRASTSMTCS